MFMLHKIIEKCAVKDTPRENQTRNKSLKLKTLIPELKKSSKRKNQKENQRTEKIARNRPGTVRLL